MQILQGFGRALVWAFSFSVLASLCACGGGGGSSNPPPPPPTVLAPSIAYSSPFYSFTNGVAALAIIPKSSGGAVVSWSVNPALPAGLALSATDGSISGTPTAGAAPAQYVVTATNSGGTSSAHLTIAVSSGPLVDLGHGALIQFTQFVNSSVLSQDNTGHWVLWDYSNAQELANGDSPTHFNPVVGLTQPLPVDLEGPTVVIQTATGLELRAAADGHVLVEIAATPTWWKLAADGSYVCGGSASGLTVWSPAGTVLFTQSGNYANALVFAAAAQLQIALGAAGIDVIQTISVPGGTSALSPAFQGQFQSWFTDGGRFLSSLGSAVWVYSKTAVQQDLATLSNVSILAGQGNWYWTFGTNSTLTLYAVGSGGTATSSYPIGSPAAAVPSGTTVGLFAYSPPGQVTILDLSGASPVATNYPMPIQGVTTYAATSAATWVAGAGGFLVDGSSLSGQPRYLGYGAAVSISGSMNNVAVATESGRILIFDAATNALQATIDQPSSNVVLSADGTVLASAGPGDSDYFPYATDKSIRIFSLPSGTTVSSFPFTTTSTPTLLSMTMSASGTVLGEILTSASPCIAQAVAIPGGGAIWCAPAGDDVGQLQLSPNGTLVAAAPPSPLSIGSAPGNSATNIYLNGTLSTAVAGWAVGWIDNNTLLVNNAKYNDMSLTNDYAGAAIYGAAGLLLSSPALPQMSSIQPVSSSLVYSLQSNAIYSLTSGALAWSSGSPIRASLTGAIGGTKVVFPSGNLVLTETY